ncbi:hypothetical protein V5799_030672 [Amblyomma americanum]|uniref:Uncharacterized protein n=1 Tax=Amblyomma americanum TaxID=6943 RepID=A0AAQ4EME9_AMBAM
MEMNVKRILDEAREKIFEIDMSAKDLGIWKRLMLSRLLQEWSWVNASDSEEEGDGKEKAGRKGTHKKSRKRIKSNQNRKITNGLREEFKDDPRASKRRKPEPSHEDEEEAGRSGLCTCDADASPRPPTPMKAGKINPSPEERPRLGGMAESFDLGWILDQVSVAPLLAPIPDSGTML